MIEKGKTKHWIVCVAKIGSYKEDIEVEAESAEIAKSHIENGGGGKVIYSHFHNPEYLSVTCVHPSYVWEDNCFSYVIPHGTIPEKSFTLPPIDLSYMFDRIEQIEKLGVRDILHWVVKASKEDKDYLKRFIEAQNAKNPT